MIRTETTEYELLTNLKMIKTPFNQLILKQKDFTLPNILIAKDLKQNQTLTHTKKNRNSFINNGFNYITKLETILKKVVV